METRRVELPSGGWAEIRTLTAADLQWQRREVKRKKIDDDVLNGLLITRRAISSWSFGEVTEETFDALTLPDVNFLARETSGIKQGERTVTLTLAERQVIRKALDEDYSNESASVQEKLGEDDDTPNPSTSSSSGDSSAQSNGDE